MAEHIYTGAFGEDMAAAWFKERDYIILEKNWRFSHWEVDIIARKNKVIHFIEVKTRRSNTFGHPEDDVSKKKMRFLMSSAEQYLYKHPGWKLIQFDILAITMLPGKPTEFFLIEDVGL